MERTGTCAQCGTKTGSQNGQHFIGGLVFCDRCQPPVRAPGCVWRCTNCKKDPVFYRRCDWGFNMADAVCPTGCQQHSWEPKPIVREDDESTCPDLHDPRTERDLAREEGVGHIIEAWATRFLASHGFDEWGRPLGPLAHDRVA